jgi:hypothetical protein
MTLALNIEHDVRAIVEATSAPFTIERFAIRVGEDGDGEATILIDVWHPLSDTPVDARHAGDVRLAVLSYFNERGEKRFPWVRQHFADGQRFARAA